MKPVVEVHNLSKAYQLGSLGATSVRESIENLLRRRRTKAVPSGNRVEDDRKTFWALRDVSFSVKPGEVVGIVGRNGAGKSTLLKILSRITEPTSGKAILRGRVASLLEVGTGFHPELTGRENIFLNGTILGMRRVEIAAKFDEIVEFAGVGEFIDTPVKRYSSGMFVRLAFAVAAHLEPEILLIDEVLAVGDAAFQKKCLGKMGEVATQHGRTVFFVSHNMGAVRSLCEETILIDGGRVVMTGKPGPVISHYLTATLPRTDEEGGQIRWPDAKTAPQTPDLVLRSIRLLNERGIPQSSFEASAPIEIELEYQFRQAMRGARFSFSVMTQEGEMAFCATDHQFQSETSLPGIYRTTCHLPGGLLNRRHYILSLQCDIPGERYIMPFQEFLNFTITGAGNQASIFPESWPGVVCPRIAWTVEKLAEPPAPVASPAPALAMP